MSARKSGSEPAPEDILRDHSLEIQAIANRLRSLVKELAPEAHEKAYPRWRGIGYRHPTAGYFCGIFPQEAEVRLLFEWGILLPDPKGILSGDGQQVRYVPVRDIEVVDREAVAALIKAALALPDSLTAKRHLVAGRKKGP